MDCLFITILSMAMTIVIACVHSGYITVTMTATATAIVERPKAIRSMRNQMQQFGQGYMMHRWM